jgi:hypothetical protein
VISNHLTWYLGKIYSSIIATAKSRGRKKGNIKLEDVLDGVSRDSTNDVPDVPDVSVCDPDVE